jgi:hypothetical protein
MFVGVFSGVDGTVEGSQCVVCAKIVPFKGDTIPNRIRYEECSGKPADGLCETLPCSRIGDD